MFESICACPKCGLTHFRPGLLRRLLAPHAACLRALGETISFHELVIAEVPGGISATRRVVLRAATVSTPVGREHPIVGRPDTRGALARAGFTLGPGGGKRNHGVPEHVCLADATDMTGAHECPADGPGEGCGKCPYHKVKVAS